MLKPSLSKLAVLMRSPGKTAGGIHIPDRAQAGSYGGFIGDVAAVGPGTLLLDGTVSPTFIQPGDVVSLNPMCNGALPGLHYKGRDYVICTENDVLATVDRLPIPVDPEAPALVEAVPVITES